MDTNEEEAEEDEVDLLQGDPQLKKEEQELSKIATGIGKVFLKTVHEREKLRAWKRAHIDPRNASRTPSAKTELHQRLRYENPVNACTYYFQ
jgi:actin-binding LIM protein